MRFGEIRAPARAASGRESATRPSSGRWLDGGSIHALSWLHGLGRNTIRNIPRCEVSLWNCWEGIGTIARTSANFRPKTGHFPGLTCVVSWSLVSRCLCHWARETPSTSQGRVSLQDMLKHCLVRSDRSREVSLLRARQRQFDDGPVALLMSPGPARSRSQSSCRYRAAVSRVRHAGLPAGINEK